MSWCREFNIINEPSNAIDVASLISDFSEAEAAADYDEVEGTDLVATDVNSQKVTLSAAEYGIMVTLTDNVQEDSISGLALFEAINGHMARALALAWTDDLCALFTSLNGGTAVGTTTVDLTIANMLSAQTTIRVNGGIADDGLVYVLDNQQVSDLEGVLTATNAAAAVYATATDRLLGVDIGPNNGMGASRHVLNFRSYPCHSTAMTDAVNTGADVSGACFTPDGPRNGPYATFGNAIKRLPRFETERSAKGRSTDLVLTMRMGVGEINDGTGVPIETDA